MENSSDTRPANGTAVGRLASRSLLVSFSCGILKEERLECHETRRVQLDAEISRCQDKGIGSYRLYTYSYSIDIQYS